MYLWHKVHVFNYSLRLFKISNSIIYHSYIHSCIYLIYQYISYYCSCIYEFEGLVASCSTRGTLISQEKKRDHPNKNRLAHIHSCKWCHTSYCTLCVSFCAVVSITITFLDVLINWEHNVVYIILLRGDKSMQGRSSIKHIWKNTL